MNKPYNTFVPNNTHHAYLRCTLWWVFDFYKVSFNTSDDAL
ncbi:hypothetical protein [Flavobacterium psychrophilum]|nr:hypothetical protein [Flavobacterium psychrophilum]MEB3379795.1 hypothetical protein [Flavobacterium psychrophilum]